MISESAIILALCILNRCFDNFIHSLGGSNPGPSQDQDRLECGPMSLKHIQTHGPNFQHFPTVHSMSVYVPHNPQLI